MSEWTLNLPIRDRDERIDADALCDLPMALPPGTERELARDLLLQGRLDGLETVGAVHDRLAGVSPDARRRVLDGARRRAGLATTTEVEDQQRFEVANRSARLTGAAESPWQVCSATGCLTTPTNPVTQAPAPTDVRKWWCPAHRDQAQPGDMEPRPLRIRRAPSGALVEYDPDEEAREAARAESRAHQQAARLAESRAEAERMREFEEAQREQVRRLLPPGVPG